MKIFVRDVVALVVAAVAAIVVVVGSVACAKREKFDPGFEEHLSGKCYMHKELNKKFKDMLW